MSVTRCIQLAFATLILAMAGCASVPDNSKLEQARAAVNQASGDNEIARAAPVAIAEAQHELNEAEQTKDAAMAVHSADLALIKVQTARAKVRQKQAEKRAETASQKADDLQLNARAAQAEEALRRAQAAERRAQELRKEADAARAEAEQARQSAQAERTRVQSENQRLNSASERLNEVQQSLAELKPKLTGRGLVLTFGEVLFNFDNATLKPYTQRIVDRLATFLQDNAKYKLKIEGHTDNQGTATYNLELSRARAKSVADALISRGVSAQRMSVTGYGEGRPLASNETEAGRRENRRVEVVISPD